MKLQGLLLSSVLLLFSSLLKAQEIAHVKGLIFKTSKTWWDSSTPKEIYPGVTVELYQTSNKIAETKTRDGDGQYILVISSEFARNQSLLKIRVIPTMGAPFELNVADHMIAKHEQWDHITNKNIPYIKIRNIFIGPDDIEARYRSENNSERSRKGSDGAIGESSDAMNSQNN